MSMSTSEMTVLVSSCDKYADVLPAFHAAFEKYWPDCEYDIQLVTESPVGDALENFFSTIHACGQSTPWTVRLQMALQRIKSPYIMLILDDFFLNDLFTNEQAEHYLSIVKKHNAGSLRLTPSPKPQKKINAEYGEYPKGEAYRVCAQAAIWNRQYLERLLQELGPSELWGFERNGSFLSERYTEIALGTYKRELPYTEIICNARWLASGLRFCCQEELPIHKEIRTVEPVWYWLYRELRGVIFRMNPTFFTKLKLRIKNDPGGR